MRILNRNLKVWYSMTEFSGSTLIDKSKNGNNGTIVNSLPFVAVKNGRTALNHTGTTQYVDCGFSSFTIQNYTLCIWIKPGSTQNMYADICGMHRFYYGTVFQQDGSTTNRFNIGEAGNGSSWSPYYCAHQFTANEWQFATYIQTTAGGKLYVNGLPANVIATTSARGTGVCYSSNWRLGDGYLDGARYFNGQIGEFMIFERALSLSEIKEIYRGSYFY